MVGRLSFRLISRSLKQAIAKMDRPVARKKIPPSASGFSMISNQRLWQRT